MVLDNTLMVAGGVHLPVGTSSRLVVGTWWLYVVIVMAYYSSNLIAFLTVPEPHFFELRSSGNLRFLLKNHREKPHACIRDYDAETRGLSKPIGLSELESAFLLLLLGTAASSLLVPVEFAARWARTRRRARKLRPPAGTTRDNYAWSWPNDSKARPFISLRHGWKRADKAVWTTVGPGGHVLSDCYPAFGQFGRRPLFVQESPPFPFYQPCWGGTAVAQESEQHAGDRQQGHVVMVGNWP
ncbi:hypothetical protein V5799_029336 [Amblyomma americanum]|uniref:Ionotropic glutamate receptor C-terminal domain-containing protein n=1 Tax=Amblyomma americanum TaxID=6943 RepID=A0AAQ4ERG9_AMBAM